MRNAVPVESYPYSFLAYSYGKTLLMPGQRMGYVALPPPMPLADREQLRAGMFHVQAHCGWLFPNTLLQHAIEDLESMALDVAHLQRNGRCRRT